MLCEAQRTRTSNDLDAIDPGGGVSRRRRHCRAARPHLSHGRGARLSRRRRRSSAPTFSGRSTSSTTSRSILHFGEFGVVMLLFVIGLELRPVRLWAMRSAIFGLGSAQLVATSLVLAAIGLALGLGLGQALFIGLALSLSSTAFALQILDEKGEINTRHGRLAFSVLLFQDLAAIPLIALVPLFAAGGGEEPAMDLARRRTCHRHHRRRDRRRPVPAQPALSARRRDRRARGDDGERAAHGGRRGADHGGRGPLRGARRRSSPARCSPTPNTATRSRPTSRRSRGCCSPCSSSPSACRSI